MQSEHFDTIVKLLKKKHWSGIDKYIKQNKIELDSIKDKILNRNLIFYSLAYFDDSKAKVIIEELVKRGVDPWFLDINNQNALFPACEFGKESCCAYFAEYFDVNHQDRNNQTALFLAVKNKHFNIAAYLLEKSNVNVVDNNGRSVIFSAIENKDEGLVDMLIEHNCDLTITDNNGDTVLSIAEKAANEKIFNKIKDLTSGDKNENTVINKKLKTVPVVKKYVLMKFDKVANVKDIENLKEIYPEIYMKLIKFKKI